MPLASPLPKVKVSLAYSGVWNDISTYVYWRDKINISRGAQQESTTADPSQITLTLNNRDYRFCNRNPTSPLYGLIGRNTWLQVRSGMRYSENYGLALPQEVSLDYASTPDNAALDITGNIDLQCEFTAFGQWGSTVCLLSKGTNATSNLSYALLIGTSSGVPHLTLRWSTTGSNQLFVDTPIPTIVPYSHVAVRATLTVSSGGNHIVTVYTSSDGTLGGSWNQVGTATTVAGVTSIFSGSGLLTVGMDNGDYFRGIIHAVKVLNGIAGTAAANPTFNTQTAGATGFTDAAGRVWTLQGFSYIDYYLHTRMVGEVSSWPQSRDTSGNDVYAQITAAGVSRRLQQGQNAKPGDVMAQYLTGSQAASAWVGSSSLNTDGRNMLYPVGVVDGVFGGGDLGLGSPVLLINDTFPSRDGNGYLTTGYIEYPVSVLGSGTHFGAGWVLQSDLLGDLGFVFTSFDDGTVSREFEVQVFGASQWIKVVERAFDRVAKTTTVTTLLNVTNSAVNGPTGQGYGDKAKHAFFFTLDQSGGNVTWGLNLDGVSLGTGTITSITLRTLWEIHIAYSRSTNGGPVNVGYIGTWTGSTVPTVAAYSQPALGYLGETAGARMARLCASDSVLFGVSSSNTMLMGPQAAGTLLTLLQEAAASDGGFLGDAKTTIALSYVARASLYNQTTQAVLDYSTHIFDGDPAPTDDDLNIHNDVTASNYTGNSSEKQLASGALSVQAPPNGINEYSTTLSVNVASDGFLDDIAAWAVAKGTVDRPRWPAVPLNMLNQHMTVQLYNQLADAGLTQLIQITNPPLPLPPDAINLLLLGDAETLAQDQWQMKWNCVPADVYQAVGVYASAAGPTNSKYDAENSTVGTGFTTTALSGSIATGANTQPWTTTSAEFPFDVNIAGERITVSNIGALSGGAQTFTFSARSVNGVVKAHVAGEPVHLWNIARYGL